MGDIFLTIRERIFRHALVRARTQNEESDGKIDHLFLENQVQMNLNYIHNIAEETTSNLFQNCRDAMERQAVVEKINHITNVFAREIAALRVYQKALDNRYPARQALFLAEEILNGK